MTYIVNESCIKCKLMDCVEVCPVDCFYEGGCLRLSVGMGLDQLTKNEKAKQELAKKGMA